MAMEAEVEAVLACLRKSNAKTKVPDSVAAPFVASVGAKLREAARARHARAAAMVQPLDRALVQRVAALEDQVEEAKARLEATQVRVKRNISSHLEKTWTAADQSRLNLSAASAPQQPSAAGSGQDSAVASAAQGLAAQSVDEVTFATLAALLREHNDLVKSLSTSIPAVTAKLGSTTAASKSGFASHENEFEAALRSWATPAAAAGAHRPGGGAHEGSSDTTAAGPMRLARAVADRLATRSRCDPPALNSPPAKRARAGPAEPQSDASTALASKKAPLEAAFASGPAAAIEAATSPAAAEASEPETGEASPQAASSTPEKEERSRTESNEENTAAAPTPKSASKKRSRGPLAEAAGPNVAQHLLARSGSKLRVEVASSPRTPRSSRTSSSKAGSAKKTPRPASANKREGTPGSNTPRGLRA
mmetsp:Transcript_6355/g.20608  ORF Transcript_6355/g.20608 Transcript_6355/m.20608 type:complete len:422 (+) Transcript_6355:43-1308(+)